MGKKSDLPATADTAEVQAAAAPAEATAAAAPADVVIEQAIEIPPVPGGGSWTWDGAKWTSNDPQPADQAEESQPAEE